MYNAMFENKIWGKKEKKKKLEEKGTFRAMAFV